MSFRKQEPVGKRQAPVKNLMVPLNFSHLFIQGRKGGESGNGKYNYDSDDSNSYDDDIIPDYKHGPRDDIDYTPSKYEPKKGRWDILWFANETKVDIKRVKKEINSVRKAIDTAKIIEPKKVSALEKILIIQLERLAKLEELKDLEERMDRAVRFDDNV